jgi:opacity protein-like surface antigen
MRWVLAAAAVLVASGGWATADTVPADSVLSDTLFRDLGDPIAATSFDGGADFDHLVEPVGLVRGDCGSCRRFYIAPIVGASWGEIMVFDDSALERQLFGAGGAAGVAITRPMGQLRLEAEGRYRDSFTETLTDGPILASLGVTDDWSAMVNLWRDFSLTRKFGVYGGGGIGAGGYRFGLLLTDGVNAIQSSNQQTAFAWQAGGGFLYAVSDRITLDLGYRYYSVAPAESPVFATVPPAGPVRVGQLENQFLASELLLTVRIYEPFRRWRR